MTKKLNDLQKQAIGKEELEVRNLLTIHLEEPIRILENETLSKLEIGGEKYISASVERSDIETSNDGALEKVDIKISNIDRAILSIVVNREDALINTKCTLESVIFDDETNEILGEPIKLFVGYIGKIDANILELNFTLERLAAGHLTKSPYATYDVNCQHKKFKDERCGYKGAETKCDKTLTRCRELGNSLNFLGFPSIPIEMVIK